MAAVRAALFVLLAAGSSLGYNATEDIGDNYAESSSVSESLYDIPSGFILGAGTSAYQIEGAWNTSGKGPSIWDVYFHNHTDMDNGDVACKSYARYKKDVNLLKNMKFSAYRLSISWPRILPNGTIDSINDDGLDYYETLIERLVDDDIVPVVTMYYWDLPQALQNQGGWAGNSSIQDYFVDYANLLFDTYGDNVQWWITFNDPYTFCLLYEDEEMAGPDYDPGVAVYQCAYNVLLAHARVYDLYYSNYSSQGGQVGISLHTPYTIPLRSGNTYDEEAAEQYLVFRFAWFADPVVNGNWPETMIKKIAAKSKSEGLSESRLPSFTQDEQELLAGSADFLGLNHFTSAYASYTTSNSTTNSTNSTECSSSSTASYSDDIGVTLSLNSSWELGTHWSTKTPWGLRGMLNWISDRYDNISTFVTENGYNGNYAEKLKDFNRIGYMSTFLRGMLRAVNEDGCNVIGHITYSLLDNLEWTSGYSMRFGLYWVNFNATIRPRVAKRSVAYMKRVIKKQYVTYHAYD